MDFESIVSAIPPPGQSSDLATVPRTLSAVIPVLAADLLPWILGICVLSVILLILIIVAPWRGVRSEPKLDDEIEARLLLGEDPDEIDRDLAARVMQRRGQVSDSYPSDET